VQASSSSLPSPSSWVIASLSATPLLPLPAPLLEVPGLKAPAKKLTSGVRPAPLFLVLPGFVSVYACENVKEALSRPQAPCLQVHGGEERLQTAFCPQLSLPDP